MTLMDNVSPPEPSERQARHDDDHARWEEAYDDVRMKSFCDEERWLENHPEPVFDENPPNMFTEADDADCASVGVNIVNECNRSMAERARNE